MADETSYSIKEMLSHIHEDLSDRLNKIDEKQAVANGRTAKLENAKIQIWTAISVLLIIGGTMITLVINAVNTKIDVASVKAAKEAVTQALLEYQE
jgi:hypothetical protein